MLSSPDTATALDFLKGKENPFASLAHPQRHDDYFLDLHVPELLAKERQQVWQIIDHYRIAEFTRTADLPATAVVTILGDRGAGKTHLLQSLGYREDGKSQILVRPTFFDSSLAIEEFLLNQLVATLLAVNPVYGSRPIDDLAAALTRRLLRQTIRALGPTDRLFALSPDRWHRLRLLVGGGQREIRVFDDLVSQLETARGESDLPTLVTKQGLAPQQCHRLVLGHLRQFENRPEMLPRLRNLLYAAMSRAAFLGDNEHLHRLLEGEYTQLGPGARGEVVNRVLHALTEICAMVRQPIVFAFDNLERLFNPQNQFDSALVSAFWNSLAQLVDSTKGLLILVFAERGLFEKASSLMDSFAQARIGQGVPVYGLGPVHTILLNPPSTPEVQALINARLGRLMKQMDHQSGLPQAFPFAPAFLEKEVAGSQNLRTTLTRLRDEYSRRVYQQQPAVALAAVPPVNWESLLQSRWQAQLTEAGRKLTGSLAGQRQVLHAGFGLLLQRFIAAECEGWKLIDVQPSAQIGDNPTYGLATVLTWQRTNGNKDGETIIKLGIGFLLAQGTGMAPDLQAKFDFFRRPMAGDQLLVLWSTQHETDDLVDALPEKTRAVWKNGRNRKKSSLRRLAADDVRTFLAFPEWLNSLAAQTDPPPPSEVIQTFCREHFHALLEQVVPMETILERTFANED